MYFLDFLKEYRFFCVILIEFLYSSPPQRKKIFKKNLAAAKRRYSVFHLHAATVYSICCIIAADDGSLFFMFQDGDPSLPPEKRNQVSFNFINTYANRYS